MMWQLKWEVFALGKVLINTATERGFLVCFRGLQEMIWAPLCKQHALTTSNIHRCQTPPVVMVSSSSRCAAVDSPCSLASLSLSSRLVTVTVLQFADSPSSVTTCYTLTQPSLLVTQRDQSVTAHFAWTSTVTAFVWCTRELVTPGTPTVTAVAHWGLETFTHGSKQSNTSVVLVYITLGHRHYLSWWLKCHGVWDFHNKLTKWCLQAFKRFACLFVVEIWVFHSSLSCSSRPGAEVLSDTAGCFSA